MDNETGATIAAPNEATDEKSGNLSLDDLTQQILAGYSEEEDESDNASDQDDTDTLDTENFTEESEEEELDDDSDVESEEESQEESEEDTPDVLSKFGIDLDTLTEEDAIALNKALGGKSHKRINQLVAQKKQLEEELSKAKAEPVKAPPEADPDDGFDSITTVKELETQAAQLQDVVEWVEDILESEEPQYDDEGNEYLVELNGEKKSKSDLLLIKRNAQQKIRKGIPKRRQWIEEHAKGNHVAVQQFPDLAKGDSEFFKLFNEVRQLPFLKSIQKNPWSNVIYAYLAKGHQSMEAEQKKTAKAKPEVAPKTKPKTLPVPEGAGVSRSTPNSRKEKAAQVAASGFAKSGSVEDFARMLELKL